MKVYLCGPIAGCSLIEALQWRAEASELLTPLNITPVNPLHKVVFGRDENIVETDKADIDNCAAVLAYPWKVSVGSSMEILYANERGKLVVVVNPEYGLSPWVRYHADHVVASVAEAVQVLARHAQAGVGDKDPRTPLPLA